MREFELNNETWIVIEEETRWSVIKKAFKDCIRNLWRSPQVIVAKKSNPYDRWIMNRYL